MQEIRAFGLFLQGLIGQIDLAAPRLVITSSADDGDEAACALGFESLRSVMKWCLCSIMAARPTFQEVVLSLTSTSSSN